MLAHRFNWMGSARSESASALVCNFRDSADFSEGSLRYRDYQQRRQVAKLIRERLGRVKEDLGLLPPSEFRDPSPPAESAFTPQKLRSARDLAASVRTLLMSQGDVYISYMDGSAHRDLAKLLTFNERAREGLDAAGFGTRLPSKDDFSTEQLERLVAKEGVLRKRLDEMRSKDDPAYCTTFVLPEGGNVIEFMEAEEFARENGDCSKEALEKEYRDAREATRRARSEYGARANAVAKSLLQDSELSSICTKVHQTL